MTKRLMAVAAMTALAFGGCNKEEESVPKPVGPVASKPAEPPKQAESPAAQIKTSNALADQYLACCKHIDAGNWDAFKKDCVVGEFTGHVADIPQVQNGDETIEFMKAMKSAFPDMKMQPQLVAVSGQNILAVTLMTGTHEGPLKFPGLPDVPATHKKIGTLFFQRLLSTDGKTEQWTFSDSRTIMGQLGLAPKYTGPIRPVLDRAWEGAPNVVVSAAEANDRENANIEGAKQAIAALNTHKAAEAAATVTDDVVESDQAAGKDVKGKKEFVNGLEALYAMFPDVKFDAQDYWAAGDWIISVGTMRGMWKSPMGSTKSTGKSVSSGYAEVIKMQDGKAAEIWLFRNGMTN